MNESRRRIRILAAVTLASLAGALLPHAQVVPKSSEAREMKFFNPPMTLDVSLGDFQKYALGKAWLTTDTNRFECKGIVLEQIELTKARALGDHTYMIKAKVRMTNNSIGDKEVRLRLQVMSGEALIADNESKENVPIAKSETHRTTFQVTFDPERADEPLTLRVTVTPYHD